MPMRPIRTIIDGQRVVIINSHATIREAAELMSRSGVGALPVVDREGLAGIITERDLLVRVVAAGRDPASTSVSDVMTAPPATIAPDRPVLHAMHVMQEGGFRHLPVVEGGRVVGVISMRDAMGREIQRFERDCAEKQAIAEIIG